MKRRFIVMMLLLAAASTAAAMPAKNEAKRVADAATVIKELRSIPDNGIPESIWESGSLRGRDAGRQEGGVCSRW